MDSLPSIFFLIVLGNQLEHVFCGTHFGAFFAEMGVNAAVDHQGRIYLINNGPCGATVNVATPRLPGVLNVTVQIPPNDYYLIESGLRVSITGNNIREKGIEITSDEEIMVQIFSGGEKLNSAYAAPDISELGTTTSTMTHQFSWEQNNIQIMATEDGTTVTVNFKPAGTLYIIEGGAWVGPVTTESWLLQRFQVKQFYVFGAQVDTTKADYSGSEITADKPIMVTTGTKLGDIFAWDRIDPWLDEMPDTSYYGTEHVLCPHLTRSTGYMAKVVGLSTSSTYQAVDETGATEFSGTVPAYGYVDHDVSSQKFLYLFADNPLMVGQFIKSTSGETHMNSGPSMTIIPPLNQWVNDYTMVTMRTWDTTKVRVPALNIGKATSTCDVMIDGVAVTGWTAIGATGFEGVQVQIAAGKHRINSSCGDVFSAIYYDQALEEAFMTRLRPTVWAYACWADSTAAPSTAEPTTLVTTTIEPTTVVPSTDTPTTIAPTTIAPTTVLTTTYSPTTSQNPTTVDLTTTVEPTTVASTTMQLTTVAETTIPPATSIDDASSQGSSGVVGDTTVATTTTAAPSTTTTAAAPVPTTTTAAPATTSTTTTASPTTTTIKTTTPAATTKAAAPKLTTLKPNQVTDVSSVPDVVSFFTTSPDTYNITDSISSICLPGTWEEWGAWGWCSTTCTIQTRSRACPTDIPCDGNTNDHKFCDMTYCNGTTDDEEEPIVEPELHKPFGVPALTEADKRPSAITMGTMGIVIMVIFGLLLLLMDIKTPSDDKPKNKGNKKKNKGKDDEQDEKTEDKDDKKSLISDA